MPRLRQAVLVAADLDPTTKAVQSLLDLGEPFHDPGVEEFGLRNAVFAVGDTFLEIVSPVRDGTTAGRYMERIGGDGGYMAIFQVPDVHVARARIADLGIRVVWQIDLPDIAGTHLHPKDVPGAIVSIDAADPPETWRWAGPAWTGNAAQTTGPSIASITVSADDPTSTANTWAAVLGVEAVEVGAAGSGAVGAAVATLALDRGQSVRFVGGNTGITEIAVTGEGERDGASLQIGTAVIRRGGPRS